MSARPPLRIAIIGGGLAGATLATALLKYLHLTISIFESAPEFSERGAAVGIAANGQAALAEMGGPLSDVVERAGGVFMTSSRLCMVRVTQISNSCCTFHGDEIGADEYRLPDPVPCRSFLISQLSREV